MDDNKLTGYEPLYIQVSNYIKNEIKEGNLVRGHKLPSEDQLVKEQNVSRGTVRKALLMLNEEGYIETIHGKGSFVKDDRISTPIAQQFVSFAESLVDQGLKFKTEVLKKEIITAENSIQYDLKISENSKVLYLERLRTIENTPSILLYNWVSLDRCLGIEKYDFENIGLFEAMEETMGKKINYGLREFSALNVNDYIKSTLELKNDAVLRINQTSFNSANDPIERSDVYLKNDKYQITSLLQR